MDIAAELKALRIKRGLRQADIAAAVGVDVSLITHIERGRNRPSFDVLVQWLSACGAELRVVVPDPEPMNKARLADLLKSARVATGLSQAEFARRMGISTSSACNIEAGNREPSIDVIAKWGEVCGCRLVLDLVPAASRRSDPEPTDIESQLRRLEAAK